MDSYDIDSLSKIPTNSTMERSLKGNVCAAMDSGDSLGSFRAPLGTMLVRMGAGLPETAAAGAGVAVVPCRPCTGVPFGAANIVGVSRKEQTAQSERKIRID